MSILVVGSVGLDTIETPSGKVDEILGGSAVHFSVSASHFSHIGLLGVVGDDFPEEHKFSLSVWKLFPAKPFAGPAVTKAIATRL